MIILLNLISLNNNIAQFDDRAVRRPRGATTVRHDRAGWTGKNLILDEALVGRQGGERERESREGDREVEGESERREWQERDGEREKVRDRKGEEGTYLRQRTGRGCESSSPSMMYSMSSSNS